MKKCVTRLLAFVLLTYFLCGCNQAEPDSSEQLLVQLTEQAKTYICENMDDAMGAVIEENGVEIAQILYGRLTADGEQEALLICKIPQMAHVGGLDRTIVVCYEMQSGEMHSPLDLPYDELDIVCVENAEKALRLLTIGTGVSQGFAFQNVVLYSMENNDWCAQPFTAGQAVDSADEVFYYPVGDRLLCTLDYPVQQDSVVMAVLEWNPEKELFE